MVISNHYLTADFYADDALKENFQLVVSDFKCRITNRDTVISIALINQLLPVGYNRAKQIFLKLKNEGYLDDRGRLLFESCSEDKGLCAGRCDILKSVQELCVDNTYSKISEAVISQRRSQFLSSGFPKLDKLIKGFEKGKVYIIAGRPGCGKSVLYVSTEKDISEQVFFERITANLTNVSIEEIKSNKELSLQNIDELLKKIKQFDSFDSKGNALSKLYFSFTDGVDVSSIKECINQLNQHEHGISCLIVDPVVSYPTPPSLYRRNLKSLKDLAQQLNVPVILISLTSKAAEKRVNSEWQHPTKQKPIVEDICFSSIVKEYVDVVLLMERRIYRSAGSDELKSKGELKVYRDEKSLRRAIHFIF